METSGLRKKGASFKIIIEYIVSFSTIFSMLLVFFTLSEMQVQRNNSYMPTVVVESSEYQFTWGDQSKVKNNYIGLMTDDSDYQNYKLNTYNIGVGVAKNVSYTFNSETIFDWIAMLNQLNPSAQYSVSKDGNRLNIVINGLQMNVAADFKIETLFLQQSVGKPFVIYLPPEYSLLIKEIFPASNANFIEVPPIMLDISYTDIQGKKYEEEVLLYVESTLLVEDSDGNGFVNFSILVK